LCWIFPTLALVRSSGRTAAQGSTAPPLAARPYFSMCPWQAPVASFVWFCILIVLLYVLPFPPTFSSSWRSNFVQIDGGTVLLNAKFGTIPQKSQKWPKNSLNWRVGSLGCCLFLGSKFGPWRHQSCECTLDSKVPESLWGMVDRRKTYRHTVTRGMWLPKKSLVQSNLITVSRYEAWLEPERIYTTIRM